MGTTDNFDTPNFAGPILAGDTVPIISSATGGRGATARVDQIGRGGYGTPFSDATAGAITYTAAQILGGIIVRDPNGASRTDILPTAALLVAAITRPAIGDVVKCLFVNGADAAETITFTAGAGGGFDANQTAASRLIGQNAQKIMHIRLTNVTAASEAYVIYV
jgi:hypothetical protein